MFLNNHLLMRFIVFAFLLFLYCTAARGQAVEGQVRGRICMADSLEAGFCRIVLLQKNDTACFVSIKFTAKRSIDYKSCNVWPGTYTLCIDMEGFSIIYIEVVVIRADMITFQDITLHRGYLQKPRSSRTLIRLPYKPPNVKGCGG